MKKNVVKRLLAVAMVAAMAVSSLAGCSNKSDSDKETTTKTNEANDNKGAADDSQSGEVVTLKIVDWESEAMNTAMQDAFDNVFSVEHPNIKVEIMPAPVGDYGLNINGMITAGEAPDIFQAGHDMALSLSAKGMLTDWSTYADADTEFTSGFYEGTYDLWKNDGKTIGFPSLINTYGIFYNKDILAAAGLEEPKTGWTYDDLFTYANTLKKPEEGKYGLYNFDTSCFNVSLIGVSNGGTPFVDNISNPTKVTVDDQFKAAAQKVTDAIAAGAIPGTTYDGSNSQSLFESGEIGMLYFGQWELDNLIRNVPDLNWGYVANPVGTTGEQAAIFDAVGWCSPKGVEHEKEVWELMKFMSSYVYETVLPVTPVASCAYEEPSQVYFDVLTEKGHAEASEAVKTMMSAKKRVAVRFLTTWAGDAGKVWNEDYSEILDGKNGKTVDMLPEMAERINQVIADNQ
jgi:ABC-type glycerol-3-phosphate transport system substrate-binding protein